MTFLLSPQNHIISLLQFVLQNNTSVAMTEVPGRKSSNAVVAGSADAAKPRYCHICDDVAATAFCTVCGIHLCQRCVHNHKKVPATKFHRLLTGPAMPSVAGSSVLDSEFDQPERCPDHQKEEIKVFCTKHEVLCCVACTVVKHQSCPVVYIPDVSKDFAASEDYQKLVERIQIIDHLVAQCQTDIPRCKDAVDKLSEDEIGIFRSFKAEIIAYLDKREAELLTDIQRRRDEDDSILQNLKAQSESIKKDIEEIKTKLRGIKDNPDMLFITSKRAQGQVARLESALDEIQQKTGYRKYELLKDDSMEAIINSATGIATVEDAAGITLYHLRTFVSKCVFYVN